MIASLHVHLSYVSTWLPFYIHVHLSKCNIFYMFTCPPAYVTDPPAHLSIYQLVNISTCPLIHLFMFPPFCLSTCLHVHLSPHQPVNQVAWPYGHQSTCQTVHLAKSTLACLPFCQSACIPVHLFPYLCTCQPSTWSTGPPSTCPHNQLSTCPLSLSVLPLINQSTWSPGHNPPILLFTFPHVYLYNFLTAFLSTSLPI